jgi:hypothetical protein
MYKIFWVLSWRRFLVRNQRFGTACLSHLQGLEMNEKGMSGGKKHVCFLPPGQKTTPGKNPKDFIQHIMNMLITFGMALELQYMQAEQK